MPLPQRKSPRLPDYPYTTPGAYFVTICTHDRLHLFGEIAAHQLAKLPIHYPSMTVDCSVVMPNHVHTILILHEDPVQRPNLSAIVGNYKAGVSRIGHRELDKCPNTVWQGRFHDHIIRDEGALSRIRDYVQQNPQCWEQDTFYS